MRHAIRCLLIGSIVLSSACYQRASVPRDRLDDALASCPRGDFDSTLIRANTEIEVDPSATMSSRTQWENFCEGNWRAAAESSEQQSFALRRHVPGATYGLIIGVTLGTVLFLAGSWALFIGNL